MKPTDATIDENILRQALDHTIEGTDFPWLGRRETGKVRDNYLTEDGRRFMITTDRVSAFDRNIGTVPFKGQVLHGLAAWWFEQTKELVPNHVVRNLDPNVLEVVDCKPLPVEFVVRAYITGVTSTSIWTHYAKGERVFCGHRLPEGLRQHERLPEPILTPSTKAPQGGHDVSVSREEILEMGHVSAEDFDTAAEMAMKLFAFGQKACESRGLILVDTKYEFGKRPDGTIVVIDEIHTPDSSRFWYADTYQEAFERGEAPKSFDKEYVRRWLAEQGFRGDGPVPAIPDDVRVEAARRYVHMYEAIVGEAFSPDTSPAIERMERALRAVL